MPTGLAELFITPERAMTAGDCDKLEEVLQRLVREAKDTWRDVEVADHVFVRYLAERMAGRGEGVLSALE